MLKPQYSTIKSPVHASGVAVASVSNVSDSRLAALLLVALSIANAGAVRTVFSPVQEIARLALGLTDLQMSLVQGLAVSIPIALLAIPIGRLVDRSSRVRLLVALAACNALGTFLTATAPGFATLFVARMLVGLGALCSLPVAISIAADLSAVERRGRAILMLSLGQWIGIALAFALGGVLVGAAESAGGWFGLEPWRAVHVVFGIAAVVVTFALMVLREPERLEVGGLEHPPLAQVMSELWSRRGYLVPLFVGQIGVVMADVAAGIWAAPVLTRDLGLSPEQFAGAMGAAMLIPGITGSIAGGLAADLGLRSRRRGGVMYGAVVAAAVAIPTSLFPLANGLGGFAGALGVFLFCGIIAGLITATVIATYIPNELRGVCLGAFVVISSVIGMGIAPSVVSLISTALGGEAHLAAALAGTGFVISIVSLLAFTLAAFRLPASAGARTH